MEVEGTIIKITGFGVFAEFGDGLEGLIHITQLGSKNVTSTTDSVVGYMSFETEDISKLHQLLELHPVYIQGGTLELCETPKT